MGLGDDQDRPYGIDDLGKVEGGYGPFPLCAMLIPGSRDTAGVSALSMADELADDAWEAATDSQRVSTAHNLARHLGPSRRFLGIDIYTPDAIDRPISTRSGAGEDSADAMAP
jgi:hypothetical protein